MAITSEFKEAVESRKKIKVRIMLKDSMLVDPTMRQFDEMLNYAKSKIGDLYDEHDDETLNYDRSEWGESYMNNQMVVVVNNFSKERVELLRNMVRYIYRDRVERMTSNNEYQPKSGITKKNVGIGMTFGGAATAVVGICASQGLIIAGGAAIAAVGVGLIIADKG
jgi:hypothetical protein